jgi:uncharacterized protein
MKNILLLIIDFYQKLISVTIKNILGIDRMCKFSPTCSEYARKTIHRDGIFLGLQKSAIRIFKCQPFYK